MAGLEAATPIDPATLGFDVDGVVADTMRLFLDLARDLYDLRHLRYEDLTGYDLQGCLNLPPEAVDAVLERILDGRHTSPLRPIDGAARVLRRLAHARDRLVFVTARPYPGPIAAWLEALLALPGRRFDLVATGDFAAKLPVLRQRGIRTFVEDRLETCFDLQAAGIRPVLFRQPWNRREHPFLEVASWHELEACIAFDGSPEPPLTADR